MVALARAHEKVERGELRYGYPHRGSGAGALGRARSLREHLGMKLKLFLICLALAIVLLALGGWTLKGIRRTLRVPALALAGARPSAAGASA